MKKLLVGLLTLVSVFSFAAHSKSITGRDIEFCGKISTVVPVKVSNDPWIFMQVKEDFTLESDGSVQAQVGSGFSVEYSPTNLALVLAAFNNNKQLCFAPVNASKTQNGDYTHTALVSSTLVFIKD